MRRIHDFEIKQGFFNRFRDAYRAFVHGRLDIRIDSCHFSGIHGIRLTPDGLAGDGIFVGWDKHGTAVLLLQGMRITPVVEAASDQ